MYNSRVRHILAAIAVAIAIVFAYYRLFEYTAVAVFAFLFITWTHYRQSSILLASKYFKNGDLVRAVKYLDEVPNPDRLARNRRGYYEFMMANIALKREDYTAAEYHFQIASRFPLGGKNEKGFVMIHLANIALRNRDTARAGTYIAKAKELALTSRAEDLVRRIEKEIEKLNKKEQDT